MSRTILIHKSDYEYSFKAYYGKNIGKISSEMSGNHRNDCGGQLTPELHFNGY